LLPPMTEGPAMILATMGSLIVGAIGGGIGWGATEFVARPIRKFFDLRADAIRMVSQYGNLRARFHEMQRSDDEIVVTEEDLTLSETDIAKLHEADVALRTLAAQMRGFAYNESIANHVLRLARFDPKKASEGLFGIANTIDRTGKTRIENKRIVTKALRLPEHTL
jgi:hypothetical protein